MSDISRSTTPWYRQFWPWFIIALPASVVVAGLTTVYIAFNNADTLVNDNYYRDGLVINQQLALDQQAIELGMMADIQFDLVSGEVLVEIKGQAEFPDSLELMLLHPVDETRDMALSLGQLSDGRYRADLAKAPANRYYLRLKPRDNALWRLNGELDFDKSRQVSLIPNA